MLLSPRHMAARIALRGRARGAAGGHRAARVRGDARLSASSWRPARTRRSPRPWPSWPCCARSSRRPLDVARPGERRSPARTRRRAGRTSRSRPARATAPATRRCASSPGASRRSRLHVHVAVPDPEAAVRAYNGDARRTCRCCSRCPPTRRSGRAATAASRPRARPPSRCSRAPASRAASALTRVRRGGRHPAAQRRDPRAHVPVVGRAPAAAATARSRCGSWTPRRASATPPRWRRWCSASSGSRRSPIRMTPAAPSAPEVLAENRFLASRDGMQAELDRAAVMGAACPVGDRLQTLRCTPALRTPGRSAASTELARVAASPEAPAAARQRALAAQTACAAC